MPPILTDAERDRFVLWLDAEIAEAEQQKSKYETLHDELMIAAYRKESVALRIVALKLCTDQIVEEVTQRDEPAQRTSARP